METPEGREKLRGPRGSRACRGHQGREAACWGHADRKGKKHGQAKSGRPSPDRTTHLAAGALSCHWPLKDSCPGCLDTPM